MAAAAALDATDEKNLRKGYILTILYLKKWVLRRIPNQRDWRIINSFHFCASK
jgi:hypothetical protein